MLKLANSSRENAIIAVKRMLEEGKTIYPLPFGDGDTMFVSSDEDAIKGIDAIEVGDKVYLIGFKK